MAPEEKERPPTVSARLRRNWFPLTAIAGSLTAFGGALLRERPEPKAASGTEPAAAPPPAVALTGMQVQYDMVAVLGNAKSTHPFRTSLHATAAGPADRIYALGDGEIRIFEPDGRFIRSWKAGEALCFTVGPDGRVCTGGPGRVDIYDGNGNHTGGFPAGDHDRPAHVTSIKLFRDEILAADGAAKYIRRYGQTGKQLGLIGTQNRTGGFMLPNRSLDIAVDQARSIVYASDSGRHRVTSWSIDGTPGRPFGRFGMRNPEDFVGCCNPVNIAVTPDGNILTAEKVAARLKVYEPGGKLLAMVGPGHFDPACTFIRVAVDSKGRILAADPVRRTITVFSPAAMEARRP
jgi:hypothetical protein